MNVPDARRCVAAAVLAAGALLVPGGAAVAADVGRVAILAPDLAMQVEEAAAVDLRARGFIVVPERELYRAIERLGLREDTAAGRKALVRVLRLAATMTIAFPHPQSRLTAEGLLRDGDDQVIDVWRWAAGVDEAAALPATSSPPPPPPLPPPAAPPAPDPMAYTLLPPVAARPRDDRDGHRDVFVLAVGPRLLHRRLAYTAAAPGSLTGFDTNMPTLGLGLRADWFPLPGWLRDVGLLTQLEQTRPIRSETPAGSFDAPSRDMALAGQWRRPGPRLDVAVDVGLGLHRFDFQPRDAAVRLPRPLPDVAYRYVQAGLELRARTAGPLSLVLGGHYRHVLHAGGVTSRDWFPGARIRGADASAGIECHLGGAVTAAVGMDARLYRLDFRRSTSARLSTGATDNYYSGWARLGFRLGSTGT